MRCPFCQMDNDRVIDSRTGQDGFSIRRRRECHECKRRYTTYERMEEPSIKVIKKEGARVPFDRDKIKQGLEKACWKRPVSDEQIDAVVSRVEREIHARMVDEVESRDLGEMVMSELSRLDQVAFVRFASVYRDFADVRAFVDEVGPMLNQFRED